MTKILRTALASLTAVLLLAPALSSCDDDLDDSIRLSGEWTGNFGMFFDDGRGEWDAAYTDIRFVPYDDYSTHGWGEEIDYFDRPCPIRWQSFRFNWTVSNGVIYLTYPYNAQLNTAIDDYHLTSSRFRGRFDNGTPFSLVKLVDYYDWGLYGTDGYGCDYWDPYYYAPTRAADSLAAGPAAFTFGRRTAK